MAKLPPVPLADQVACVERELAMRRRVYARRVADGLLAQDKADLEVHRMQAVLETVRAAEAAGRLL